MSYNNVKSPSKTKLELWQAQTSKPHESPSPPHKIQMVIICVWPSSPLSGILIWPVIYSSKHFTPQIYLKVKVFFWLYNNWAYISHFNFANVHPIPTFSPSHSLPSELTYFIKPLFLILPFCGAEVESWTCHLLGEGVYWTASPAPNFIFTKHLEGTVFGLILQIKIQVGLGYHSSVVKCLSVIHKTLILALEREENVNKTEKPAPNYTKKGTWTGLANLSSLPSCSYIYERCIWTYIDTRLTPPPWLMSWVLIGQDYTK